MPLRRVMIDWDDGLGGQPRNGYFRNHRGARQGKCLILKEEKPKVKQCFGYPYESGAMPSLTNNPTHLLINEPDTNPATGYRVPTGLSCYDDTDCKFIPQCANQDDAPLFSFMLDKTCDSSYFYNEKTYDCKKGGPNYKVTCGAYAAEFPEGCCIYQPKVQVLDNWGWCNGDCEGLNRGCYGSALTGETTNKDCDDPTSSWTLFNGKVYVKPL